MYIKKWIIIIRPSKSHRHLEDFVSHDLIPCIQLHAFGDEISNHKFMTSLFNLCYSYCRRIIKNLVSHKILCFHHITKCEYFLVLIEECSIFHLPVWNASMHLIQSKYSKSQDYFKETLVLQRWQIFCNTHFQYYQKPSKITHKHFCNISDIHSRYLHIWAIPF